MTEPLDLEPFRQALAAREDEAAASRWAVPALIAEIERLSAALQVCERALSRTGSRSHLASRLPADEAEPPGERQLHRRLLGDLGNTQSRVVAALRGVVELHSPAAHGTWTVCGECAHQAWPMPTDPDAMWSTVVWPCATVREIADALGHPSDTAEPA